MVFLPCSIFVHALSATSELPGTGSARKVIEDSHAQFHSYHLQAQTPAVSPRDSRGYQQGWSVDLPKIAKQHQQSSVRRQGTASRFSLLRQEATTRLALVFRCFFRGLWLRLVFLFWLCFCTNLKCGWR